MDIPWAFDDELTRYFTVLQLLDLNTLPQATVSFLSEQIGSLKKLTVA
jgi:hypothetical protein